ncbi:hypothetical protein BTUL_0255g00010 [Botrytis tulipae]|uniref:Apple domain-containing protein n=1 Tax=Botrytis tulipae TaxID=87230 RepID=A0A4Z1E8E2_9HELO|nr:hypothetical protein BTUL_0255g00010 [Botrytis tulipae]
MKLFGILAAIAAVSTSLVLASPILEERTDVACLVQVILINLITLNHGESFCSSYLGIQTSTIVKTTTKSFTTTTVLPVQTSTTTVVTGTETTTLTSLATSQTTATATVFTFSESTQTNVVSVTSTLTASPVYPTKTSGTPGPPPAKRSVAALSGRTLPDIPAWLVGYSAASISAACSCLNLPTPSTTSVVTASQTSTVISTPPAVTSSVLTKTVVTTTTTSVSTQTDTQTLTSVTGTNTVTQTSTSTTVATETPTILSCPSIEYALPGYQQSFTNPTQSNTTVARTDVTLFACCDLCFKTRNCYSFYWGGIRTTGPQEMGYCAYFTYISSPSTVISNPPQACPLGVDTREQVNYALPRPIQAYGAGPCDLSGVPFTQA